LAASQEGRISVSDYYMVVLTIITRPADENVVKQLKIKKLTKQEIFFSLSE
jgi:hypothetical protein